MRRLVVRFRRRDTTRTDSTVISSKSDIKISAPISEKLKAGGMKAHQAVRPPTAATSTPGPIPPTRAIRATAG
jgi:hypothetical protein